MKYDASSCNLKLCFQILKNPMGEKQIAFAKRLVGEDAPIFLDRLSNRQINIVCRGISDQAHPSKWFRRLSDAYIKLCMQRMGRIRMRQAMSGGSMHVSLEVLIEALDEEKKKTADQFKSQRSIGGAGVCPGDHEDLGSLGKKRTAVLRHRGEGCYLRDPRDPLGSEASGSVSSVQFSSTSSS